MMMIGTQCVDGDDLYVGEYTAAGYEAEGRKEGFGARERSGRWMQYGGRDIGNAANRWPKSESPNGEEGRISIISPAGVALLGSQEGEVVSWRIPTGLAEFKVKKVIYQPEAAGDYYL